MASTPSSVALDDREEGEIVDDDFEDISDNSIIVPIYSGKSVSSKEHLPAISLSSVSEGEEPRCEEKLRRRQKPTRRRTSKSYKKRRGNHRKSTGSDSDSDDYVALNKKLQKQLKAAIRVDNVECHRNSLRSRLRAMTKLKHESDIEKSSDNKINGKVSSDEDDSELKQLRMEALRTAVVNKCIHRKKRKVKETQDNVLSDISIRTDTSETNKENTHNTNENVNARLEETSCKKLCVEKPVENNENKIEIVNNIVENNTPPEDDEDVLRALLLASMSKKITKEPDMRRTALPSSNCNNRSNDKINQKLHPKTIKNEIKHVAVKNIQNFNFKKRVIKNNVILANNQHVQLPKVKPLIINIKTDSESDDDAYNITIKNATTRAMEVKKIDLEIENTVDKFLKEQRAKVEAQLSPIPNSNAPVTANKSVILEKSSVKLLPMGKQIEYQKLLQKLNNAEKKPRIRRSSHKGNSDGKPVGVTTKKIVRTKVPVVKQVNNAPKVDQLSDQVPDVRSDVKTLHKTLKEMQIQKNGRLQIQEKYKVLKPIIKRINEVSIERKKCDEDVKRLLEQLAEVKKKLRKSHQDFTAHVKELIHGKEDIDKSLGAPAVTQDPNSRFTSTPIKEQPPFESFDASSIPITTPNNTHPPPANVGVSAAVCTREIRKEEDIVYASINPGDPNDIDKIYNIQKNSLPKYISPLDNVKRAVMDDPFSIVCPYDVDGNCRDSECIYKHLFN